MIVFKVYALKADRYTAAIKDDVYSHQSISLNKDFHHIRIEGNGENSINVEIRKSSMNELDGYQINKTIAYSYSGDTLILTNVWSDNYQSVNLLVSDPIQSVIAHNSMMFLSSDIFASQKNIYIECSDIDKDRSNNSQIQFVGNDIQSMQMRLKNCRMRMYGGYEVSPIASMEFDVMNSDVELDSELSKMPTNMIFRTDERTTLKAPSSVLQRMQLVLQN